MIGEEDNDIWQEGVRMDNGIKSKARTGQGCKAAYRQAKGSAEDEEVGW